MRVGFRHLKDIGGMTVASLVATATDGLVFGVLVRFELVPLVVAAALGAIVGALLHFSLCRYWVFNRFDRPFAGSLQRYALVSGVALVLHAQITAGLALYAAAGVAWLTSKVGVFTLWCYPASRYLVFGTRGSTPVASHSDSNEVARGAGADGPLALSSGSDLWISGSG